MELEKEKTNQNEESFNFFNPKSTRSEAKANFIEMVLAISVLSLTYICVNHYNASDPFLKNEVGYVQNTSFKSMYTEKDQVLFEAKTHLLILKDELRYNENLSSSELAKEAIRLNATKEHILDVATLEGRFNKTEAKMLNEIVLDIDEVLSVVKDYSGKEDSVLSIYQKQVIAEKVNLSMSNVSLAEKFIR